MSRRLLVCSFALLAASCAATKPSTGPMGGVVVLPMKASVFVRATFDSDASSIIGNFIPDEVADGSLDETQGARTICSDFIRPKKVAATGEVEEVFGASSSVGGKLGVKGVAQLAGERSNTNALRIKYNATEKLVADVDTKGLYECCKSAPEACSKRYISMSIAGDGRIFAATETADKLGAEGSGSYQGIPITGDVMYKDGVKWERTTEFKGQYFAFSFAQTGTGKAGVEIAAGDCTWTQKLPRSPNGVYFIGVSAPTGSESVARQLAMTEASKQVVKYIGEWLDQSAKSNQVLAGGIGAVGGEFEDQSTVETLSKGLAKRVKDEAWCGPEKENTPKGEMKVMKVLAFFPYSERAAATKIQLSTLMDVLKQKGTLTPAIEQQLKASIDAVK